MMSFSCIVQHRSKYVVPSDQDTSHYHHSLVNTDLPLLMSKKLFGVGRALASRALASRKEAAGRDDETVLSTPFYESRMMVSLSIICLVVSIIVVAIADEIERRSAASGPVGIDSADNASEKRAIENNPYRNTNSPAANSKHHNDEQSTLQELDDLVNDIVNSSARRQREKNPRQLDDNVKYDNFLKLIKS